MQCVLLPGLGFDQRIFGKLDFGGHDVRYLNWMEPEAGESFATYTRRLAEPLVKAQAPLILIGHSLGGMLSQEIATFLPVQQIILISSIRSRRELPIHFRLVYPLRLHYLFTKQMTYWSFPLWGRQHDYVSQEEQTLFKDMVARHSNRYLRWALRALSLWQGAAVPDETLLSQIHGQKDKTFPSQLLEQPDQLVPEAGHFMVYKHPEIINTFISEQLAKWR